MLKLLVLFVLKILFLQIGNDKLSMYYYTLYKCAWKHLIILRASRARNNKRTQELRATVEWLLYCKKKFLAHFWPTCFDVPTKSNLMFLFKCSFCIQFCLVPIRKLFISYGTKLSFSNYRNTCFFFNLLHLMIIFACCNL